MSTSVMYTFCILIFVTLFQHISTLPPGYHENAHLGRTELIIKYHAEGLTYLEIINVLAVYHGLRISYCALRKLVRRLNLPLRRGRLQHSDMEIRNAIGNIMPTLARSTGYRNLHLTLKDCGYNVRRDQVMRLYKELDPDGAANRRKRKLIRRNFHSYGADFSWHLDGM